MLTIVTGVDAVPHDPMGNAQHNLKGSHLYRLSYELCFLDQRHGHRGREEGQLKEDAVRRKVICEEASAFSGQAKRE